MSKIQTSTRMAAAALSLMMTFAILAATNVYSRPAQSDDSMTVKLEPVVIRGERIAQPQVPAEQAAPTQQAEQIVNGDRPV